MLQFSRIFIIAIDFISCISHHTTPIADSLWSFFVFLWIFHFKESTRHRNVTRRVLPPLHFFLWVSIWYQPFVKSPVQISSCPRVLTVQSPNILLALGNENFSRSLVVVDHACHHWCCMLVCTVDTIFGIGECFKSSGGDRDATIIANHFVSSYGSGLGRHQFWCLWERSVK